MFSYNRSYDGSRYSRSIFLSNSMSSGRDHKNPNYIIIYNAMIIYFMKILFCWKKVHNTRETDFLKKNLFFSLTNWYVTLNIVQKKKIIALKYKSLTWTIFGVFFAFIFLFYVWHFIQFPILKIYLKYYYFKIPAVYTCIFVHFLKEY